MSRGSEPQGLPAASVADVLRVLGVGVNHAILRRLSKGPLRSEELKKGIAHYAPRTVERHLPDLIRLGAVAQERDAGTAPPAVTYELTRPAGRDLLHVLEVEALPGPLDSAGARAAAQAPAKFKLLAEAWESGIAAEVGCEAQAQTELAKKIERLSFHQLGRRLRRLGAGGMLSGRPGKDGHKRYEPTEEMRRSLAVAVAAIGHWRRRHVVADGAGLSAAETASLLRCALPLVGLPECAGKTLTLTVVGEDEESVSLWGRAERGGHVRCGRGEGASAAGSVRGTVTTWITVLLDGKRGRLQVGGDCALVDACTSGLRRQLRGEGFS